MKKVKLFSLILSAILLTSCVKASAEASNKKSDTKIQVAILLDTSNSMDGLIDQAKSRLWDIVNTLTTLKYKGENPEIEIALYEYGNNGLSEKSDYIRRVTPLTTDLDLISEMLFGLTTNGGLEYCGAVINEAVKSLEWGLKESDMKLIYIAGNEEFNQGSISYKEAISTALSKGIYVNTIYCGDKESGIRELWKSGADNGKGKYFNIDYNAKVRYISTPYDDRISKCNEQLNATYITYGSMGESKKMNQIAQDENAKSVSKENYTARTVSKSKKAYKNTSWDLVDKYETEKSVSNIKKSDLPKDLQNKSEKEIEKIIVEKQKQRMNIQNEINELAKKRQEYIDTESKKANSDVADDLGKAINASVLSFAKIKGYSIEL